MTFEHLFLLFIPTTIMLIVFAVLLNRVLGWLAIEGFWRWLIQAVFVVEIVFVLLHTLVWQEVPGFWEFFLDLDQELTFGTMFASSQLFLVGLAALIIALKGRLDILFRLYIIGIAVAFAYLAADEFYALHERSLTDQNSWPIAYWIGGAAFIAFSVYIFWRNRHQHGRALVTLVAGVLVTAGAATVTELFLWDVLCLQTRFCQEFTIFEEAPEMFGATLALVGMAALSQTVMEPGARKLERRLLPVGGLLWLLSVAGVVFVLPALELRLLASPAQATYLDGELALLGYRLSETVAEPGDQVTLTLYFRAEDYLTEDYDFSVHAFAHPEIESVAQVDDLRLGAYPNTAWLPNLIVSKTVTVPLPADVPAPRSYWLALRLWYGDWEESWENTTGVVIDSTDLAEITDDTIVLASLPVLVSDAAEPPATPAYHFADGFELAGYVLPASVEAGETVEMQFWWETERDIDNELTQYLHLIGEDGTVLTGFDEEPFDGTFPTEDWPKDMEAVDTWEIPLPEDVPPGVYQVFTGLYDTGSRERVPVTSDTGQPVADNNIELGTITIDS